MNIIEQAFNQLKAEGIIEADATCDVYGPEGELISEIRPDSCQHLQGLIKNIRFDLNIDES